MKSHLDTVIICDTFIDKSKDMIMDSTSKGAIPKKSANLLPIEDDESTFPAKISSSTKSVPSTSSLKRRHSDWADGSKKELLNKSPTSQINQEAYEESHDFTGYTLEPKPKFSCIPPPVNDSTMEPNKIPIKSVSM